MSIGLNKLKFFGDLQSSLVMRCAVMTKKREYSFFLILIFLGSGQAEDDCCECLDGPSLVLDIVKVE